MITGKDFEIEVDGDNRDTVEADYGGLVAENNNGKQTLSVEAGEGIFRRYTQYEDISMTTKMKAHY
jgi:hypothetical protein